MDYKLELIVVPVSDVDRSKRFYDEQAGFHVDVDHSAGADFRIVQLTPPGSSCSVTIMKNPGSAGTLQGLHLVVADIDVARDELLGRGVEVSEVYHFTEGRQRPGHDPERRSHGSFLSFADPDGNGWLVQEVRPAVAVADSSADGVLIREATDDDWAAIWPFFRRIVAAGDTYTYDRDISEPVAREVWLLNPPGRTVVAVEDGVILGTAKVRPNHDGPGAHIANASFMVDPDQAGRGVGRTLAQYVLDWARDNGFTGMQFNAVAASNARAVALWQSLGMEIMTTIPGGFRHPQLGDVGLHVMFQAL